MLVAQGEVGKRVDNPWSTYIVLESRGKKYLKLFGSAWMVPHSIEAEEENWPTPDAFDCRCSAAVLADPFVHCFFLNVRGHVAMVLGEQLGNKKSYFLAQENDLAGL